MPCFTDLLVSHSLTRLSREPETSWYSCDGAHFTAVTQPVWDVRDSCTSEPSVGRGGGRGDICNAGEGRLGETPEISRDGVSGTFGSRVPQSDVPVGAAGGQPATQRGVGNTVEHFAARL